MKFNKLDNAGIASIVLSEGNRLTPYLDSCGIPTIGIGCTHYENGIAVTLHDPSISLQRSYDLFNFWAANKIAGLNHIVTSDINQNQFDALISFCYNGGVGMLKNTHLLAKVNANPNDPTIADEFMKFVFGHDTHHNLIHIDGLVNRRTREVKLYFTK